MIILKIKILKLWSKCEPCVSIMVVISSKTYSQMIFRMHRNVLWLFYLLFVIYHPIHVELCPNRSWWPKYHYQLWGSKWSLTLIPDRLNINPDQGPWMVSIRPLLPTYTRLLTVSVEIFDDFMSCPTIYFETPLSVLGFGIISNFNSRSIRHKSWSEVMNGIHTVPLVNLYMSVNSIHNNIWWFHFVWINLFWNPIISFGVRNDL